MMKNIPWPLLVTIVVVIVTNACHWREYILFRGKAALKLGTGENAETEEAAISIQHFTKDYGMGKGVFDVTLLVRHGEVYGYLGPNGAGKSTTMRHLMGFSRPLSGSVRIEDMECWREQKKIQEKIGYLPGEIAFPDDMTGIAYLRLIARMRKLPDLSRMQRLLETFELKPEVQIKRMSKGMKQKLGIVAAFMHDPDILLLDEPTSGLDPLMQNRFIELIQEEKKRGKTILLSSHIFDEVEKVCDRVGMIRDGKLIQEISMDEMRGSQLKTYQIEFADASGLEHTKQAYPDAVCRKQQNQLIISIIDAEINHLLSVLSQCRINSLRQETHTLEEYFMWYYGGAKND